MAARVKNGKIVKLIMIVSAAKEKLKMRNYRTKTIEISIFDLAMINAINDLNLIKPKLHLFRI